MDNNDDNISSVLPVGNRTNEQLIHILDVQKDLSSKVEIFSTAVKATKAYDFTDHLSVRLWSKNW